MTKKSIIFLIILVALIAISVIVSMPDNTRENQRVWLADFESGDLKGIDFVTEDGVWGVEYDGEWKVKDSEKTDKVALDNLLSSILKFDAKLIAENNGAADEYGITDKSVRVEYEKKNGERKVFVLGNKTPPETEYYLMDEDKNIYSIYSEVGDAFRYRKYRVEDSFVFGKEYEELSRIDVDGNPSFSLINRQSSWSFESVGRREEISIEDIRRTVTRHFGGMYSLEKLDGTDENNKECGFDGELEITTVTISDFKGNKDKIYIGRETDNGVYIKLNDNDEIYRVIADYFGFIKLYREGV